MSEPTYLSPGTANGAMNVVPMWLTIGAVRAWLRSKHPGDIVGYAGGAGVCPLAKHLEEQGVHGPSVGSDWINGWWAGNPFQFLNIGWTKDFTQNIDAYYYDHDDPFEYSPVSAAKALEILEGVAK